MCFRHASLYFQTKINGLTRLPSVRQYFLFKWFWQLQSSSLDLLLQHTVFAFFALSASTPNFCGGSAFKSLSANWRLLFSPTQVQSKQNWESRTRTLRLINFTTKVNVARDVYGEDNKYSWIRATLSLEKANAVKSHSLYEETFMP